MKRYFLIGGLIAVSLIVAFVAWRLMQGESGRMQLTLFGNIDLRQVQLSFNNSERIAAVLVQEGDRVRQGQLLARLDTARLEPQLAQAEAQAAAQLQVVKRLRSGSRPEEIAQAHGASRRSLGLVIVGGLVVSQFITLFISPVIYLYLEQFQEKVLDRTSFFRSHRTDAVPALPSE